MAESTSITPFMTSLWEEEEVKARPYNTEVRLSQFPVLGDGNCLFRCFACFLNDGSTYASVRHDLIQYMTTNMSAFYIWFQFYCETKHPDKYLQHMAIDKVYGTSLECRAFSLLHQVTVCVWSTSRKLYECHPHSSTKVCHLLMTTADHYDLLTATSEGTLYGGQSDKTRVQVSSIPTENNLYNVSPCAQKPTVSSPSCSPQTPALPQSTKRVHPDSALQTSLPVKRFNLAQSSPLPYTPQQSYEHRPQIGDHARKSSNPLNGSNLMQANTRRVRHPLSISREDMAPYYRQYALREVDVPGDGNCLFWCLRFIHGDRNLQPMDMRNKIAKYITSKFDVYREHLQIQHNCQFQTPREYREYIMNQSNWGSCTEILALAQASGHSICVWDNPCKFFSCYPFGCREHVFHVLHKNGNHYCLLYPSSGGETFGTDYPQYLGQSDCICVHQEHAVSNTVGHKAVEMRLEHVSEKKSFTGVTWTAYGPKISCLLSNGIIITMSKFDFQYDAARARDYLLYRHFGPSCSRLMNFPYESFCMNGQLQVNEELDLQLQWKRASVHNGEMSTARTLPCAEATMLPVNTCCSSKSQEPTAETRSTHTAYVPSTPQKALQMTPHASTQASPLHRGLPVLGTLNQQISTIGKNSLDITGETPLPTLQQYTLTRLHVPTDNSSLFWCLRFINRDINYQLMDIRRMIADYVSSHFQSYKQLLSDHHKRQFHKPRDYTAYIMTNNQCGTLVEIHAFAMLSKQAIYVWSRTDTMRGCFPFGCRKHVSHVHEDNGHHYSMLIPSVDGESYETAMTSTIEQVCTCPDSMTPIKGPKMQGKKGIDAADITVVRRFEGITWTSQGLRLSLHLNKDVKFQLYKYKVEFEAAKARDYILYRHFGPNVPRKMNFSYEDFCINGTFQPIVALDKEMIERRASFYQSAQSTAHVATHSTIPTLTGRTKAPSADRKGMHDYQSTTFNGVTFCPATKVYTSRINLPSGEQKVPYIGGDNLTAAKHRDYCLFRMYGPLCKMGTNFPFQHYLRNDAFVVSESLEEWLTALNINISSDMLQKPYNVPGVRGLFLSGMQNFTAKFYNEVEVTGAYKDVLSASYARDYCLYRHYGTDLKQPVFYKSETFFLQSTFQQNDSLDRKLTAAGIALLWPDQNGNRNFRGIKRRMDGWYTHVPWKDGTHASIGPFASSIGAAHAHDTLLISLQNKRKIEDKLNFTLESYCTLPSPEIREKVETFLSSSLHEHRPFLMNVGTALLPRSYKAWSISGVIGISMHAFGVQVHCAGLPHEKSAIAAALKIRSMEIDDDAIYNSFSQSLTREELLHIEQILNEENVYYLHDIHKKYHNNKANFVSFLWHTCHGPTQPCVVCDQLFFRADMRLFLDDERNKYIKDIPTFQVRSNRSPFICLACHTELLLGKMPRYSTEHGFAFPTVSTHLQKLEHLEERLVALRIPFMSIRPCKGIRQASLRGGAVNIPANVETTVNVLPRLPDESYTIFCHFKRRIADAHSVFQETIRPEVVRAACEHLCSHSDIYRAHGIQISQTNLDILSRRTYPVHQLIDSMDADVLSNHPCEKTTHADSCLAPGTHPKIGGATVSSCTQTSVSTNDLNADPQPILQDAKTEVIDDNDTDDSLMNHGIKDTLLLSTGFYLSSTNAVHVAPGEGNSPLPLTKDSIMEEGAFPTIYNGQKRRYTDNFTFKQVDKWEIRNRDMRISAKPELLFLKLIRQQYHQTLNAISTRVRRDKVIDLKGITAGDLLNPTIVNQLQQRMTVYNDWQSIVGSPDYFKRCKKDMMAFFRMLGMPGFFITTSMADTHWHEFIQALSKCVGKATTLEQTAAMSNAQKISLIQGQPVTSVRYYHRRKKELLKLLVHEDSNLFGGIADYFCMDEFQQRGAPHTHSLLWTRQKPPNFKEDIDAVVAFIDQHITSDSDLLTSEQVHMQTHKCRATCSKKKGANQGCRFKYPKMPSTRTVILTPLDPEIDPMDFKFLQKRYKQFHSFIKDKRANNMTNMHDFLEANNVSEEEYIMSLRSMVDRPTVLYKRKPKDACINTFNLELLNLWNGNIDVQFCLDPYAVASYISSYITKGTKGISALMTKVLKEPEQNRLNIKTLMHKVGALMINSQEVSVHEAVYLLLGISLRSASRAVQFINTSRPTDRVITLHSRNKLKAMPQDSTDIISPYMLLRRYCTRDAVLEDTCLARYVAYYDILGTNKSPSKDEEEQEMDPYPADWHESTQTDHPTVNDDMHRHRVVQARKKARVIRYTGFSRHKQATEFIREQVMLYRPFRDEQDILNRYMQYWSTDQATIKSNREEFQPDCGFDFEQIECFLDREEEDDSFKVHHATDEQSLLRECCNTRGSTSFDFTKESEEQNNAEYTTLVQQLNHQQRAVLDHCMIHLHQAKESANPLQLFITGGAGVGKSVLIDALDKSMTRFFNRMPGSVLDLPKVLKLAFTGVAAFNIGGTTAHSGLHLPPNMNPDPEMIKNAELIYNLRLDYSQVKAIIIDECSQISYRILRWINCRLCQIRECTLPFGGLHVLLVGDLFQLAPVMGSQIFVPEGTYNCLQTSLWDSFLMYELQEVMRQKEDKKFAELLNRLREGQHTVHDIEFLKSLESTEGSAIPGTARKNLYYSNSQCDEFNRKLFETSSAEKVVVHAVRLSSESHSAWTRKMKRSNHKEHHITAQNGGYVDTLHLYIGQSVFIGVNIDVSDGLANGTSGTVMHFTKNDSGTPTIIWVKFDLPHVAAKLRRVYHSARQNNPSILPSWSPIFRRVHIVNQLGRPSERESIYQFPLRPADAITIHKSQGMSLHGGVIDLKGCNVPHMHYVAISRFKTPQHLTICNLNPKSIKVDPLVQQAMQKKRSESLLKLNHTPFQFTVVDNSRFTVYVQNVSTMTGKYKYFATPDRFQSMDVVCLMETRHNTSSISQYHLKSHPHVFHAPGHSFANHGCIIYSKSIVQSPIAYTKPEYQLLSGTFSRKEEYKVILLYIKPSVSTQIHQEIVSTLECHLDPGLLANTFIVGDFNCETTNPLPCISVFLQKQGFVQRVLQSTTHRGTSIDHVWTHQSQKSTTVEVQWTHFSDHFPLVLFVHSHPNSRDFSIHSHGSSTRDPSVLLRPSYSHCQP